MRASDSSGRQTAKVQKNPIEVARTKQAAGPGYRGHGPLLQVWDAGRGVT